ncbi:phosphotransferase [Ancylomarina sp. DW003]|nr:phosphotransferase [Ancylomarina sp. DW003]MDE5423006.1 phosphotransferase [Ancylomarina sp. DW003]
MKNTLSIKDREIIQKSFLSDHFHGKECWTQGELPEGYDYYFSEKPFKINEEKGNKCAFSYINNPDGSVRWIFASNSKFPGFLDLYNGSGIKGKMLTILFRIIFFLNLQFIVTSGQFYFFSRRLSLQESWKKRLDFDSFSVFTGTVGPNRKVLFALHKKNKTIGFVKHPISYESLCLVSTENKVLKTMEGKKFSNMLLPESKYLGNGDVFVNNVRDSKTQSNQEFTNLHALALKDLYTLENSKASLKDSQFHKDLISMMASIKLESHVPFHHELNDDLQSLLESIDFDQKVSMARAHMDFTPWNLFVSSNQQKLAVIDWELSKSGMPLLFDLFHYVFQSKILVEKQNYKDIYQSIEQVISENTVIKELVEEFAIDVKLHFRLYLLQNIAYYLNIYQKQADLHIQVNWLTAVWKEALECEIKLMKNESYRKIFISDLFQFMKGKRYAWLHSRNAKIANISTSSDIDFLISEAAKKEVIAFCKSHVLVGRVKSFQKSFMANVELFFSDGSFLSLDLITKLVRKNLVFMDANKALDKAICNSEGIKLPRKKDDLNYLILFYLLNNSKITEKYLRFFGRLENEDKERLRLFVYTRYGIYGANLAQTFKGLFDNKDLIKNQISNRQTNSGFRFVKNSINYTIDTLRSLIFQKGLVISFSGVDGAGKSTLIADVAQRLKRDYRKKIVILRHRPSLFPILSAFRYGKSEAEKRAANTLPHQGKNYGSISSILRFAYYYADYLLGQIYVNVRYVSRAYVVLYDRYYFDFINDQRRSNISLSKKLVNRLYALVYKPRHNFFFYASSEIIRERKKELSANEISRLTKNYFSTFNRYGQKYTHSKYHCIENIDREETLQEVFKQVQNSL